MTKVVCSVFLIFRLALNNFLREPLALSTRAAVLTLMLCIREVPALRDIPLQKLLQCFSDKQIVESNCEPYCIKESEDMLGGEIDICEHAERLWLRGTTAMVSNAFKICDSKKYN